MEHGPVFSQNFSRKAEEALLSGDIGEMGQKLGADASILILVFHHERNFRGVALNVTPVLGNPGDDFSSLMLENRKDDHLPGIIDGQEYLLEPLVGHGFS